MKVFARPSGGGRKKSKEYIKTVVLKSIKHHKKTRISHHVYYRRKNFKEFANNVNAMMKKYPHDLIAKRLKEKKVQGKICAIPSQIFTKFVTNIG
jgi:hypothetical protein